MGERLDKIRKVLKKYGQEHLLQKYDEMNELQKEELLSQMDLFLKQFTKLKETIENDDVETMKEIMRVSTRNRSYFDK